MPTYYLRSVSKATLRIFHGLEFGRKGVVLLRQRVGKLQLVIALNRVVVRKLEFEGVVIGASINCRFIRVGNVERVEFVDYEETSVSSIPLSEDSRVVSQLVQFDR